MKKNYKKILSLHKKNEHISLALHQWKWKNNNNSLLKVKIDRPLIPKINIQDIDPSVFIFNHHFKWPFYIEAMTGGSSLSKKINCQLATISRKYNLAMAVGSESIAINNNDPDIKGSFSIVRKKNPHGFILANIGANHNLKEAKEAIKIINANALEIHLNTVQELSSRNGDRIFKNYQNNIKEIIQGLKIPVIIKEVGFGMSKDKIHNLSLLHPAAINIAGNDGTDFGSIEERRNRPRLWPIKKDKNTNTFFSLTSNKILGISTLKSLQFAKEAKIKTPIIANGGINNTLEVFNAMATGAKMVGIAGYFLSQLNKNKLKQTIINWQRQLPLLYGIYNIQKSSQISHLKKL